MENTNFFTFVVALTAIPCILFALGYILGVKTYAYTYAHFKKFEEAATARKVMLASQASVKREQGLKQTLVRMRDTYGVDLSEKHQEGPSEEIEQILGRGPH